MLINIPIEVPEAIIKMGGIELYANMYASWSPTLTQTDEEGNTTQVDNPVSALDKSISFNQKRILDDFKSVMLQMGREQGEKQALEQFNSLFPA